MSIVQAHLPAAKEREERMLCHDEQGRYTYLSTSAVKSSRSQSGLEDKILASASAAASNEIEFWV